MRERTVTLENDYVKHDVAGREAYIHGLVSLIAGIVTLGGVMLGAMAVAFIGLAGIVLGSGVLAVISAARTGWSDYQQKRKSKS